MKTQQLVLKPEFVKVRNQITGYTGKFTAHQLMGILLYEFMQFIPLGNPGSESVVTKNSITLETYIKVTRYTLEAVSPIEMDMKDLRVDMAMSTLISSGVKNPFTSGNEVDKYLDRITKYLPFDNNQQFLDNLLELTKVGITKSDDIKYTLESLTVFPTFCTFDLNELYFSSMTNKLDKEALFKGIVWSMVTGLFPVSGFDNELISDTFDSLLNKHQLNYNQMMVNINWLKQIDSNQPSEENERLVKGFFDRIFTVDNLHEYQELFTMTFTDGIKQMSSYDQFSILQSMMLKPFDN